VGQFECSNDLLNRIHRLIVMAIRSNLQHVLTDCPHREKLGWLEQAHLMGQSILCNYDAGALLAKVCGDVRDAQHDNGCVPTIAPQYTSFKPPWDVFNDSPEWGSAMVLVPWLVYQHRGDEEILRDNYEAMRRYVEYLRTRETADGLVDYGLGDWYDIGPGDPGFAKLTSKALTATAVYYRDVVVLRHAAEVLGRRDDAETCAARARRIARAFNERLFDAAAQTYDTGSQTACAMPLALGLVPPEYREAVVERLVQDVRRHGNHVTAGDIGFYYVLTALAEAGRSDVIFDLLARTDPPSYGAQLARGATTLTEAWDANPKNSQNHMMLGYAEGWLHRWLAGIQIDLSRPSSPPRRQIVLRPTPVGDVTWARATHDSPLGRIDCRWEREGNRFKLEASVPAAATVYLPDGAVRQIESGPHVLECALLA
jgi:hypothetical protein